jgi:hypothetical protein
MIVVPREKNPGKGGYRWKDCHKCAQPKKMFCTLHYQLYLHRQDNNAAESLASICNNSGNNEPLDVSAIGNLGGDHSINNNNRDVTFVNNVGDLKLFTTAVVLGLTYTFTIGWAWGASLVIMTMAHHHPVETMALKLDGLIMLSRMSLLLLGTLVVVMQSIIITLMWLS